MFLFYLISIQLIFTWTMAIVLKKVFITYIVYINIVHICVSVFWSACDYDVFVQTMVTNYQLLFGFLFLFVMLIILKKTFTINF